MKMNAFFIIFCITISLQVQAQSVSVSNFSIIRKGGGQIHLEVSKGSQHRCSAGPSATGLCTDLVVTLKACNYKEYSDKSFVIVSGSIHTPLEAISILNNDAILATDVTPRNPYHHLTGTWSEMRVSYSFDNFNGETIQEEKSITKPIVLIDGQVSSVLGDLENQTRENFKEICN